MNIDLFSYNLDGAVITVTTKKGTVLSNVQATAIATLATRGKMDRDGTMALAAACDVLLNQVARRNEQIAQMKKSSMVMLKQEMARTKECLQLREVLAEIAAIKKPQMCMNGNAIVGSPNATGYDYQHIARAALAAAGVV